MMRACCRVAIAAVMVAASLTGVPAAARATAMRSRHAATLPDKKTYMVKAKLGRPKRVPEGAGAKVLQSSGCAPPLIGFSRTELCLVFPATVEVILEDDGQVQEETYTFGVQADVIVSATSAAVSVAAAIIP